MQRVVVGALVALTLPFSGSPTAAATGSTPAERQRPIPVILATDIGDDIDDTWALAFLLRSPELDLRLVLTDYGDTVYRARLAAKLLQVAGRADVEVAVGVREAEKGGRQAEWLGDYALAQYPGRVHDDGVQALIDAALASPSPLTLVAIGPAPTLRRALEREPRIASRLRLVGMFGSVREGYAPRSKPEAEWNVKADPAAVRALFSAAWQQAIVTPLDTCGRVSLSGERYARLRASRDPLIQALLENYRLWCPRADWCRTAELPESSTTLFDTVAVYLAFARDLVGVESFGVRVGDDGMTVPDPDGSRRLEWATSWKDKEAFLELLASRLAGPQPVR